MIYLNIVTSVFFLISIRSMMTHRSKNADALIEMYIGWKIFLHFFILLSFLMLSRSIHNITEIKWFWNLVIVFLSYFILSKLLVIIYSSIFGFKSKTRMNWTTGSYGRHHLPYMDAIITFIIGLILFLMTN